MSLHVQIDPRPQWGGRPRLRSNVGYGWTFNWLWLHVWTTKQP